MFSLALQLRHLGIKFCFCLFGIGVFRLLDAGKDKGEGEEETGRRQQSEHEKKREDIVLETREEREQGSQPEITEAWQLDLLVSLLIVRKQRKLRKRRSQGENTHAHTGREGGKEGKAPTQNHMEREVLVKC